MNRKQIIHWCQGQHAVAYHLGRKGAESRPGLYDQDGVLLTKQAVNRSTVDRIVSQKGEIALQIVLKKRHK